MKKIFILALLLLTLCCHASAASSIQIDNVTRKEVNNYIVNFITASGQNYILDSATEYGLVFTATHVRENFLGIQVATQQSKLNFTTIQNGNNVVLSISEVATLYYNSRDAQFHAALDLAAQRAVVVLAVFCVLDDLVMCQMILKISYRHEVVVDAVLFTLTRGAGRGGDGVLNFRVLFQQSGNNGILAGAGRAGDNK